MKISIKELRHIIKEEVMKIFYESKDYTQSFDFSNVPKDELKSVYNTHYSLRMLQRRQNLGSFDRLNENSQVTVNAEEAKKAIERKYSLHEWQIETVKAEDEKYYILLAISNKFPEMKKELISDFEKLGYFLGKDGIRVIDNIEMAVLQFEPFYQDEITEEDMADDILIHLTPYYNAKNILKNGLIPKCENSVFQYPNRIYFINNNEKIKDIYEMLSSANTDPRNNGVYCECEIDRRNIPKNIKFYTDLNYKGGFYTTDAIPPQYIKINKIIADNDKIISLNEQLSNETNN